MAKLMRSKSKTLVAFGSCAQEGCVPGLANLYERKEILDKNYLESRYVSNPDGVIPLTKTVIREGELRLPEFYDTVRTLNQTVDVDYYLPGCPPPVKLIISAFDAIAKGELPPKGSVLAPLKSVCDECPRKKENKRISRIYRVHEKIPEPEKCLLEQGIICMGPGTRSGCGAQCLTVDMPCTGCGGPCPNSLEQGAAMISAIASILGLEDENEHFTKEDVENLMNQIKDPIGTFYMYSLPASILRRKVMTK
jgi:F420-non-reducing hydrogenase small subunit